MSPLLTGAVRAMRVLLAVCLIVVFVVGPVAPVARAGDDAPAGELKAALWEQGGPEAARIVPNAGAERLTQLIGGASAASVDAANPVINWSRLAFRSYRDGNAEIYISRADGSQPERLTYDEATDVQPKISPDLSRVVFASDRGGRVDLYTVKLDGTGLTALTNDDAFDYQPAWSPDGKRLAWRQTINGVRRMKIMNADGSAQMTVPGTEGADGMTWSPDGTQLAFVQRDANGIGTLRIIRPDGTPVQSLASGLVFPGAPDWSPDGQLIGLDYDSDGDYWNELMIFRLDVGGPPMKLYDPASDGVDAWMGTFAPDRSAVIFTIASWGVDNGELVLRGGLLASAPLTFHAPNALPGSVGVDFDPDWVSIDTMPPTTRFEPLPPYVPFGPIPLRWSGVDTGGSGLTTFDVEVSINGAPWQAFVERSDATEYVYSPSGAVRHRFRVRARDGAGNVEPWPAAGGDAETAVYGARVDGAARDVRGLPIPQAAVTVDPEAYNTGPADLRGNFTRYFSSGPAATVTASAAGYASPAPVTVALDDGKYDTLDTGSAYLALPDRANWIGNGGFETGNFSPWQVSGGSVTAGAGQIHGGKGAALLGQANTLTAGRAVMDAYAPQMVEGGGVTHVIASPSDFTGRTITYNRRDKAGNWLAQPVKLHQDQFAFSTFAAAADPNGGLHLLYPKATGDALIFEACYVAPGTTTCAPQPGLSEPAELPKLAADAQGGLHALYRDATSNNTALRYAYRPKGGAWGAAESLGADGALILAFELTVDAQGRPHALWSRFAGAPDDPTMRTLYSARQAGAWLPAETVDVGVNRMARALAVRGDGTAHALIYDEGNYPPHGLFYTARAEGGGWSDLRTVATGSLYFLRLRVDGSAPQVAYVEDGELAHLELAGGAWRLLGRWPLGGAAVAADVALEPGGAVGMIDRESEGNAAVRYRRSQLAAVEAKRFISQAVTIPAGSQGPTLAFFMRYWPGTRAEDVAMTVDGERLTLNALPAGEWSHVWADLSQWAGQTVTVRFLVQQAAGRPLTQVALDDVAAGEWLTPVWREAKLVGPLLVIGGNNFIDATVTLGLHQLTVVGQNDQIIHAELPAGLKPGRYTVQVTNAGGQAAYAAVTVGRQVFLPVAR